MLTYNREKLVPRAIESILAQTFSDFEFIIVDNGSTDASGMVADNYAAQDSRICVIHRERGNIGSGRNTGLDAATGDYIAFIDDDDWVEPDYLEFLYRLAIENNADVSICGTSDKIFYEQCVMTPENALIELMWRKKYNMGFPTKMFSKHLKGYLHFPENDKYDDISQMHKLLTYANRVAYHGLPKYILYRHENNNSAWTTNHELLTPKVLDEYLLAYKQRTDWLSEKFPDHIAAWKYFEWSFMISMVEKIIRLELKNCAANLEQLRIKLAKHYTDFYYNAFTLDFEKEWLNRYVFPE